MKKLIYSLLTALCVLTATAQTTETVTPPEDLQTAEYALQAQSYNYGNTTAVTKSLMIGIDGTTVYLQGLCEYLPQAWIKGTLDGNTMTLAAGQYFGEAPGEDDNTYPLYFGGTTDDTWAEATEDVNMTDVVLTIDAQGNMTTNSWLFVNSEESVLNPYVALTSATILKLEDKAAVPANPSVIEFMPFDANEGYAGVSLAIPTVDVDGNPLMASKLSYKIYTDIEKDIQPMLFPADEHLNIDEDMTEIPYTFTDEYDIQYGGYAAYWYHDTKTFNRIGVQSIYRGGNEENVSEISWFVIKPYADDAVTFDFNALDPETTPYSTSKSPAGDITENLVLQQGNVTLTVTPSYANTPNRYWKDYNLNALQLRLYGGTLTVEVPEGCTIEKMYFNHAKWQDENSFDCGEFDGTSVWTGSTDKCVLSIAGNTQLNSIAVVVTGTTGISTLQEFPLTTAARTYDLQGRQVSPAAKGLVLQQQRTADGQLRTIKVIRK